MYTYIVRCYYVIRAYLKFHVVDDMSGIKWTGAHVGLCIISVSRATFWQMRLHSAFQQYVRPVIGTVYRLFSRIQHSRKKRKKRNAS